jgi:hypothetical protein
LIDAGANPKSPGLVSKAAERNDVAMIRFLAKRGADLDARDATGNAALHYAVSISRETTQLLLELGASPNVRRSYDEATPLWDTIINTQFGGSQTPSQSHPIPGGATANRLTSEAARDAFEILKLLVSKHADVNIPDKSGSTPLHLALVGEKVPLEVAEWLLKQGANPTLKDSNGHNAAEAALLVRRLWLEQRTLFIPWTKVKAINVVVRAPGSATAEPHRFEAVVDFDTPPPAPELLLDATRQMMRKGEQIPNAFESIVYRATPDGVVEVSRGPANWAPLQWGDVIVLYSENPGFRTSELDGPSYFGDIQPELRNLTVKVGEREAAVQMRDSGSIWWAPMIDPLPNWNFSELISHITESEPHARLGEIKVRRTVDGQVNEWQVDLRPDRPGTSVKALPARLANGDMVMIPLNRSATSRL